MFPCKYWIVVVPNTNAGGPNPNVVGVVPYRPGPAASKLNGDPAPPPVDIEGVTGVNMNAESLEPAVPFVVAEGNVGLFTTGAGVDCVVVAVVHQLADSQGSCMGAEKVGVWVGKG